MEEWQAKLLARGATILATPLVAWLASKLPGLDQVSATTTFVAIFSGGMMWSCKHVADMEWFKSLFGGAASLPPVQTARALLEHPEIRDAIRELMKAELDAHPALQPTPMQKLVGNPARPAAPPVS